MREAVNRDVSARTEILIRCKTKKASGITRNATVVLFSLEVVFCLVIICVYLTVLTL